MEKKELCEKRLHLEGNKSVEHFYNTCHWAASCLNQPKKQSSVPLSFPLLLTPSPQTAGYAGQVAGGQREWSAWRCCFSYIFSCSSSDAAACSAFQLLQWLPAAPTLLLLYSCPLSAPVLPQLLPSCYSRTFYKFSVALAPAAVHHIWSIVGLFCIA